MIILNEFVGFTPARLSLKRVYLNYRYHLRSESVKGFIQVEHASSLSDVGRSPLSSSCHSPSLLCLFLILQQLPAMPRSPGPSPDLPREAEQVWLILAWVEGGSVGPQGVRLVGRDGRPRQVGVSQAPQ